MVARMRLTLEQDDFSGLLKLALSEIRTPEGQLIHILRKELYRKFRVVREDGPSKKRIRRQSIKRKKNLLKLDIDHGNNPVVTGQAVDYK